MYYGVARLEIHLPQSRSLKEKRTVVQRIRDRLEGRFRVAVVEVDHQDLWQRAALGFALVSRTEESARNALQALRREAEGDPRLVVAEYAVRVERFEAADGARWREFEESDRGGEDADEEGSGGQP